MEFLRVASGQAATSLAVLGRDDEALPPREAALARLATTLTAEPWAATRELIDDLARHGLDPDQVEAAVGVVAMFNYFTRVADATGIEFDYASPLPAFEPDRDRVPAPRPEQVALPPSGPNPTLPRQPGLQAAWETWREYVVGSEQPVGRRERRIAALAAAEEAADWESAAALADPTEQATEADEPLVRFARKLSRKPWTMLPADLDSLRACGYTDVAILHLISVTAHQNAATRLRAGLTLAGQQT